MRSIAAPSAADRGGAVRTRSGVGAHSDVCNHSGERRVPRLVPRTIWSASMIHVSLAELWVARPPELGRAPVAAVAVLSQQVGHHLHAGLPSAKGRDEALVVRLGAV
jgi:hypothetical protein